MSIKHFKADIYIWQRKYSPEVGSGLLCLTQHQLRFRIHQNDLIDVKGINLFQRCTTHNLKNHSDHTQQQSTKNVATRSPPPPHTDELVLKSTTLEWDAWTWQAFCFLCLNLRIYQTTGKCLVKNTVAQPTMIKKLQYDTMTNLIIGNLFTAPTSRIVLVYECCF